MATRTKAADRCRDHKPIPCPEGGCTGTLIAFYKITALAPFDWRSVGFTKSSLTSKKVSLSHVDWDHVEPFCMTCGWKARKADPTRMGVIIRLMRELVRRGMTPGEIMKVVGDDVSTIDVLGATHPGS